MRNFPVNKGPGLLSSSGAAYNIRATKRRGTKMKSDKGTVSRAALCVFAILLGASPLAFAHHGTNATYNQAQTFTLQGTVTAFEWINPHCILDMDVKGANGTIVHWKGELHPPSLLHDLGWNHDSLKPGDQITLTAHPSKTGVPVMEPLTIKFADGRTLDPGRPTR
jgi:hypothetical protein